MPLQRPDRDACAGGDLTGDGVHWLEAAEAPSREHDLAAAAWDAAAYQAGVAALRHDRDLVAGAGPDDTGHLLDAAGPHHRSRPAGPSPGPVDLVGSGEIGIGQQVVVTNHRGQVGQEAHNDTLARSTAALPSRLRLLRLSSSFAIRR
jgi:hypothetical protein